MALCMFSNPNEEPYVLIVYLVPTVTLLYMSIEDRDALNGSNTYVTPLSLVT